MADLVDQQVAEFEKEYLDYLDESEDCKDRINELIAKENLRLIIDINDLRRSNPERVKKLLNNCFVEIFACQKALKKCIQNIDTEYGKQYEEFYVGFEGSFGNKHLNPRTLSSRHLGNMVCIEGIVTKCSIIHPKTVHSVHFCPATKKTVERRYTDMTSLDAFPSSGVYPTKDEDGNLLQTEYGLSVYKDHQTLTIQEMPETAPAGQLPRSVDIVVDADLVDSCKPGDRVQIVGQYRCLPGKKNGYTNATFRTVLIANNVRSVSKEAGPSFSEQDIGIMRRVSKRKDIVDLLSRSLAPSICGHEYIKRAILCLLLGGVERLLVNGSRIRGDINVLLLGDPSVAKSQFLRFVLYTAQRAIATTGRGSSGVGLTAAVCHDPETGERHLEAGAMVLADRGIVCIDEFDKMSDIDRTAIHEVMEQGRVSISKAGIQAQLNARCSVLAAANPVYGRYDSYKSPMENIGMQDSLLSRFDLLFIVLDKMEAESDRSISEHVLRMHRYRDPSQQEGEALPLQTTDLLLTTEDLGRQDDQDDDGDQNGEDLVYEKHNKLLHGNRSKSKQKREAEKYFTLRFLQKYIHVARQLRPTLSKEAADIIAEKYCELRSQEQLEAGPDGHHMKKTQPITARTFETLIRLATAHAKARMSKVVTAVDADMAADLVSFAIFKEVLEKSRRKRRRSGSDSSASDHSDEGDEAELPEEKTRKPRKKRTSIAPASTTADKDKEATQEPYSIDTVDEETEEVVAAPTVQLSSEKMMKIRQLVSRIFQERHVEQLGIDVIVQHVMSKEASLSGDEIKAGLQSMHDENKVMLTTTDVWLI